MKPYPATDGYGTHGGYCGAAVKPIALNMVSEIARAPATARPADLRHRRHRDLARRRRVHGARRRHGAGLHRRHGLRLQDRPGDEAGLSNWMDEKGYTSVDEIVGRAIPRVTDWQHLNLDYVVKAHIDQDLCIKCGRCHIACEDTSHQAITHLMDGVQAFRGDRRGVRRLQSLRAGLPDRGLHHHGADDDGHRSTDHAARGRPSDLEGAPEQPRSGGKGEGARTGGVGTAGEPGSRRDDAAEEIAGTRLRLVRVWELRPCQLRRLRPARCAPMPPGAGLLPPKPKRRRSDQLPILVFE